MPSRYPLPYAVGRTGRSRYISAAVGTAGLLCALAAWQWGPAAARNARVLYWQRQCLSFQAQAGDIAYEEHVPGGAAAPPGTPTSGLVRHVEGSASRSVRRPPKCWTGLVGVETDAILFLHSRMTPSGRERLVVVKRLALWGDGRLSSRLLVGVWTPGTWWRRANAVGHTPVFEDADSQAWWRKGMRLQLYSGQPDPDDPTHFTIDYAIDEERGVIDGWLQEDGTVRCRVRDGPGKVRPK